MTSGGFALFATPIGDCGVAWRGDALAGLHLPEVRAGAARARLQQRFPDLGEAVPPELVVTNLHVKQVEGLWKVEIAGTFQAQPGEQSPGTNKHSAVLARLVSQLSSGPFHLTLPDPNKDTNAADKGSGLDFSRWVSRLTASTPAANEPGSDRFSIEGFLK